MSVDLRSNFDAVRQRVDEAAARAGREPGDVTIVAISKTWPADVVLAAAEAGITELGESRAQELKEKYGVVGDRVRWHFVGHLQTNKVRHVVGAAALIHSVDRFGVGEAIARRAVSLGIDQNVLIEVNVAREAAKQGVDPVRAVTLAMEIDALDGISVRGLMAMAPMTPDPADARPYFDELRGLSEDLRTERPDAKELSMGMSRDFEVAVEAGATLVRVGEAIFGPRQR